MFFLFCLAIIGACVAMFWTQSAWSAMLALVNVIIAALVATNFFEPAAEALEAAGMQGYSWALDAIAIYGIFFFCFGVLRTITDMLSRTNVRFWAPVEMGGKLFFGLWTGWVIVSFVSFTIHVAPLPPAPFGGNFAVTPNANNFLASDDQWMGYMQWASYGPLSRSHHTGPKHPDDEEYNVQTFDPNAEIPLKYYHRRHTIATKKYQATK